MLAFLALLPAALAWGHHYLITDRSLAHPDAAWAQQPVTVESLEDFLRAEPQRVATALAEHYAWLEARGSTRFQRQEFSVDAPTVEGFLQAARLNPGARFPLALRVLPEGKRHGAAIAPQDVSPYLHPDELLLVEVEAVSPGQPVPAAAVIATAADEPDWGFDHELWPHTQYGYGEQPYGKPTGESSKAPFHMQFDHENGLVRKFASKVTQGMVRDRIDLFTRLSRAAFASGHGYWGCRFAAWAAHYAQDLTQPYHSKAVPGAGGFYYVRYVLSPRKAKIEAETVQVEGNRHYLYEDFVAYGLQRSYTAEDPLYDGLAGYLSSGPAALEGIDSASALVDVLTQAAADHSRAIDKAIVQAFGPELTKDPGYDVETAPDYSIAAVLPRVSPARAEALLVETGQDFAQAGLATRTVLALVGAPEGVAADKVRPPPVEAPDDPPEEGGDTEGSG